jgi:preprotein translocase subunit SecE
MAAPPLPDRKRVFDHAGGISRFRDHPRPVQGSKAERQMASRISNPFTFLQQVRAEAAKVTWPSRRETMISTVMVLVFAVLAMLFFFAADQIMAFAVELILGIGR